MSSHPRYSTDDEDDGRSPLFTSQDSPLSPNNLNTDYDYFEDYREHPELAGLLVGTDVEVKPLGKRIWAQTVRWVPILGWLPKYSWREDFLSDFLAALTISTILVPQSMAYSILAELSPVYGLYASVIPIVIYVTFGTSRYMATGAFALTALILGNSVLHIIDDLAGFPPYTSPEYMVVYVALCMLLTFLTGLIQIILGVFRAGHILSNYLLPDSLILALNTAASYHIAVSQLKHILGLKGMPPGNSTFGLLYSLAYVATNLKNINLVSFAVGISALISLEILKRIEAWRKRNDDSTSSNIPPSGRMATATGVSQIETASAHHPGIFNNVWDRLSHLWRREGSIRLSSGSEQPRNNRSPFGRIFRRQRGRSSVSLRNVYGDEYADDIIDGENNLRSADGISADESSTQLSRRKVHVPIPDILLVVVSFTVLAKLTHIHSKHGVAIVGKIPQGLPNFISPLKPLLTPPDLSYPPSQFITYSLLPTLFKFAFILAIISYVMSVSIAKQYGRLMNCPIEPDQEMRALGLASLGGSFFSAFVCTGSLTRTAILVGTGARSQLANLLSVLVILGVLVVLTPLFEVLPMCVLAAVVLAACWSLMFQVSIGINMWREGTNSSYTAAQRGRYMWDCVIFWSTFITVVFINIEGGLLFGVAIVLVRLLKRAWRRRLGRRNSFTTSSGQDRTSWTHWRPWGRGRSGQDWARERVVYDNLDGDLVDGREEN